MSAADVSSPCMRGHHANCAAPTSCECDCHDPVEMIWEEPAPSARLGRKAVPLLTEAQQVALQKHPKRWARVREFASKSSASTAAARHRKGKSGLPLGEWEFTSRAVETGSALYAQYIGKAKA